MTTIAGIDPGLRNCGVALIRPGKRPRVAVLTWPGKRMISAQQRMEAIQWQAAALQDLLLDMSPDRIYIEEYTPPPTLRSASLLAMSFATAVVMASEWWLNTDVRLVKHRELTQELSLPSGKERKQAVVEFCCSQFPRPEGFDEIPAELQQHAFDALAIAYVGSLRAEDDDAAAIEKDMRDA